ncbi:MAG: tol-pal system-associated acyl-CoA thioesterase [Geminicoccaceae bacterium]|nr:tol-pal system-associated acyl-CoA thioesterase [Geminicoccaceae bacterium]
MKGEAHAFPVRVYYEDTDAAGIVYYANYLKFAERARTEWLRGLGLDHPALLALHGGHFAVRRCAADYRRPARLDDLLRVESRLLRAKGARLTLAQDVRHEDRGLLVAIEVELVFLTLALRPARLPDALLLRLEVA